MTTPASIRYNNPGSIWGGNALTKKWGETHHVSLHDGKHQGNQMAVFPDMIHGAAAQFDLWHTSKNYHNQTLADALRTWSGGNSPTEYIAFLTKRTPGLTPNTHITDEVLSGEMGLNMMKAQAWWEAGKPYPMVDVDWRKAQALVFGKEVHDDPAPPSVEAPHPQKETEPSEARIDVPQPEPVKFEEPVLPPAEEPIVHIGSRGEAVARVQGLLGIPETGEFLAQSETDYALRLFQVRSGLKPDGECGPKTWEKLSLMKGATHT